MRQDDGRSFKTNWPLLTGPYFLLVLLASIGLSFALHHSYLNRGFYEDDFGFLTPASGGFYGARFTSWLDLFGVWNPVRGWFYRPVFLLYWMGGLAAFGPNPIAFHAMGILLHASILTLLGLFVYHITGRSLFAALSVALFLLWPRGKEAIWWISSHSVLLAALFALAGLHWWLSYRETGRRTYYWAALLAYVLAMCSKSDAIVALGGFVCIDVIRRVPWRASLRTLTPFAFVLIVFCGLEWVAAKYYATFGDQGTQGYYSHTMGLRFRSVFRFADWVLNDLFPVSPFGLEGVAVLGVLVSISVLSWRHGQYGRILCCLGIWGACSLVPVPVASVWHALSDRFTYFPLLILLPWLVLLTHEGIYLLGKFRADERQGIQMRLSAIAIAVLVGTHYLGSRFSVTDPGVLWLILSACMVIIGVLWRAGVLNAVVALLALAAYAVAFIVPLGLDHAGNIRLALSIAVFASSWRLFGGLSACAALLIFLTASASPLILIPVAALVLHLANIRALMPQQTKLGARVPAIGGLLADS